MCVLQQVLKILASMDHYTLGKSEQQVGYLLLVSPALRSVSSPVLAEYRGLKLVLVEIIGTSSVYP